MVSFNSVLSSTSIFVSSSSAIVALLTMTLMPELLVCIPSFVPPKPPALLTMDVIIHSRSSTPSPSFSSRSKKRTSVPMRSSSWILVKSIPWSRTKRSAARVDGFERRLCWAPEDQIGRIDSRDVENECSVVKPNNSLF